MTATTVTAKATPPTGNPDIYEYIASVDGASPPKRCTVKAAVSPKQCEIGGLAPNTDYTISMHACMPGAFGCGAAVNGKTKTLPNRTLNNFKAISLDVMFCLNNCFLC